MDGEANSRYSLNRLRVLWREGKTALIGETEGPTRIQHVQRPPVAFLLGTPTTTLTRAVAHIVANKLQLQWSPQQIAGWLKRAWPGNEDYHVSHETIYRSLFIQARGALKKELLEHLRRTLSRSR